MHNQPTMTKKIIVHVKTSARYDSVIHDGDCQYSVYVKASPVRGAANRSLQRILAQYFHVPRHAVLIVRGEKSSQKVYEITTGTALS